MRWTTTFFALLLLLPAAAAQTLPSFDYEPGPPPAPVYTPDIPPSPGAINPPGGMPKFEHNPNTTPPQPPQPPAFGYTPDPQVPPPQHDPTACPTLPLYDAALCQAGGVAADAMAIVAAQLAEVDRLSSASLQFAGDAAGAYGTYAGAVATYAGDGAGALERDVDDFATRVGIWVDSDVVPIADDTTDYALAVATYAGDESGAAALAAQQFATDAGTYADTESGKLTEATQEFADESERFLRCDIVGGPACSANDPTPDPGSLVELVENLIGSQDPEELVRQLTTLSIPNDP